MPTIYQRFKVSAEKFPDRECLAEINQGQYRAWTYADIAFDVNRLASAFCHLGLQTGDHIALLLPNGRHWALVDLACSRMGYISVPIHTTYNAHYVNHIITHSDSKTLVISEELWHKFFDDIRDLKLERIIVVGPNPRDGVIHFDQLLSSVIDIEEPAEVSSDACHTIIYTSGTTGDPKGVMLSHRNILSDSDNARNHIPVTETDRFFSFLPLSHVLERTGGYYTPLVNGAAIYYASSPANIAVEVKLAKPTIMLAVPRIFEKVYEKIYVRINAGSPMQKKLFFVALKLQRKHLNGQLSWLQKLLRSLLEIIVLKKIRGSLGGRLRFAVSGGASLDSKIAKFFETVGIKIVEGYGLTETSPIVATNKPGHYKFGTVGMPIPNVEVKIGQDKEILVRGESVMLGYYRNDAATREAIDNDHWLHTGDMGFIDVEGFLTITGRIKELIILSTGKNISPVPIEQALNRTKYITQSLFYGNRQKSLSALIVPDFDELAMWLHEHHYDVPAKDSLNKQYVVQLYSDEINHALREFTSIEQIQNFTLVAEEFTEANGLMTPTLKLKRNLILKNNTKV